MYTYIGPVLIAVNPFQLIKKKSMSIYSQTFIDYYNKKLIHEVPPHIFSIAEDAFRSMIKDRSNQCVIISGESGAGKTEASKQIMQFITSVSKTTSSSKKNFVSSCLLASNPVLEAFGNAQTIRNNNSSRFGKYMMMQFDFLGDVVGGLVTIYLLEKSRVIKQSAGERNFHIFYQMLQGAPADMVSEFALKDPSKYVLLSSEYRKVPGMDDKQEFQTVCESMNIVGISATDQRSVWRMIAFILELGNLVFTKDGDHAVIGKGDALKNAAKLIGVDPAILEMSLVSRKLSMGVKRKSVQIVKLDVVGAETTRDTLSKSLYERMFKWLVTKINQSIEVPKMNNQTVIGILDIYGFEIFHTNLFEQLCINFVNEKLQQIFIDLTLKQEQEEYEAEGIAWTPIEYFNNKIVCELIEGKKPAGIMIIMDEQCALSEASDEVLLNKLHKGCASTNAHYIQPKIAGSTFTIKHYAGDVTYTCTGFVDTNKDTLFNDLIELMTSSSVTYAKDLFVDHRSEDEKAKRPPTTAMQFRKQVDALMEALNQCSPHYVRCVKPNDTKKPGDFEFDRTLHQVKYLGLVENIRIRRAGFCYRATYGAFLQRYKMISKTTWPNFGKGKTMSSAVEALLTDKEFVYWFALADKEKKSKLEYKKGDTFMLGRNKVFIRQPSALFGLEGLRQAKLPYVVTKIQTCFRRWWHQRRYKHTRTCSRLAQKLVRDYLDRKHKAIKVQTCFRRWHIQKWYKHTLTCYRHSQRLVRQYLDRKHKAIKIQSTFRMFRCLKFYKHMRYSIKSAQVLVRAILRKQSKAKKIQSLARMVVLRRRFRHLLTCIRSTQSLTKQFLEKVHSATSLQAKFKSYAKKKEYNIFKDRFIKVQARCRSIIQRRKFKVVKGAASKIQGMYRGNKFRNTPTEGRKFRETHGLVYYEGKQRRKDSFSEPKPEGGDTLKFTDNKTWIADCKKHDYGSKILFSTPVVKINRSWEKDERNIVVTDKKIILLEKLKEKRVIPISSIESISTSALPDNVIIIHETKNDADGDLVIDSERKIDIMKAIKSIRKDVPIKIVAEIEITIKKGEHRHLSFEESSIEFFTSVKAPDNKPFLQVDKKDKHKGVLHVCKRKIPPLNTILTSKEHKKLKILGFVKKDSIPPSDKDGEGAPADDWGTFLSKEDATSVAKKAPRESDKKREALTKGMGTYAASSPKSTLKGKKTLTSPPTKDLINPLMSLGK